MRKIIVKHNTFFNCKEVKPYKEGIMLKGYNKIGEEYCNITVFFNSENVFFTLEENTPYMLYGDCKFEVTEYNGKLDLQLIYNNPYIKKYVNTRGNEAPTKKEVYNPLKSPF